MELEDLTKTDLARKLDCSRARITQLLKNILTNGIQHSTMRMRMLND
jgi:hypothetical protein